MSLTHNTFTLRMALIFASMLLTSQSYAAGSGDRGRPQGPPPEATEACAELAEGDACSFTGRRNDELKGRCITLPRGEGKLACAPEGDRPDETGRTDR